MIALGAFAQDDYRSYPLAGRGSIQFKTPATWQQKTGGLRDQARGTLEFGPRDGNAFDILITPAPQARPGSPGWGPPAMKRSVEAMAQEIKLQATEKELPIREFRAADGNGFYIAATDKAPGPGGYKYLLQGMVAVGDAALMFTVLTNDGTGAIANQALGMLGSAKLAAPAERAGDAVPAGASGVAARPAQASGAVQVLDRGSVFEVTTTDSRLVLSIPRAGLTRDTLDIGGGTANPTYFNFTGRSEVPTVSGWFEPAQKFKGAKALWTEETARWKSSGMPEPRDVVFKQIGNWDAVFYEMPSPLGGIPNLRAHYVGSGTWIELHLSDGSRLPSSQSRARLESALSSYSVNARK